jgi:regulatory protein
VRAALLGRGVERETAERALEELGDDEERAAELATRRAGRLQGLAPEVAYRRLVEFLVRRGHSPPVAYRAASRALHTGPVGE